MTGIDVPEWMSNVSFPAAKNSGRAAAMGRVREFDSWSSRRSIARELSRHFRKYGHVFYC
jgi:hypothetical protein